MKNFIMFTWGLLLVLVLSLSLVSADTNVEVSVFTSDNVNLDSNVDSGGDTFFTNNIFAGGDVDVLSNVFSGGDVDTYMSVNLDINYGVGNVNIGINNIEYIKGEEYFKANEKRWSSGMTDMDIYHLFNYVSDIILQDYKRDNPKAYRDEEWLLAGALSRGFATKPEVNQLYNLITQLTVRIEALENTLKEIAGDEYCRQKIEVSLNYGITAVSCEDTTFYNAQINGLSGTGLTVVGIRIIEPEEEVPEPESCLGVSCNPVTGICDTVPDDSLCDDSNECTDNTCNALTGTCEYINKPAGIECGEARDCPDDACNGTFAEFYLGDGHDTCDDQGSCVEYSCELEMRYCSDNDPDDIRNELMCGAECDEGIDCFDEHFGDNVSEDPDYCYFNGYCDRQESCACVYSSEYCPEPDLYNDVCYYGNRTCTNIEGCGLISVNMSEISEDSCDPELGPSSEPGSIIGGIIELFSG